MSTSEMSTTGAGNTIAAPAVNMQGRNFLITINEIVIPHTEDIIKYLGNLKGCIYILVCEHIGQENKHYHLYVQFDNCKRISFKKLFGAHVDKCFGSAQQNIAYVKAEDEKHKKLNIKSELIYEYGEPKLNGGYHTVKDIKQLDNPDELPAMYYNIYKKIKEEQIQDIDIDEWHKDIKVYWIQGPSGIGKTEKAKQIIRDNASKYGRKVNILKYENGFYSGTGTAKAAIYDDFRDSHMKPSEFINLIDYNIHNLNIKGGSIQNKYEIIIFTSVQHIKEIYKNINGEPREQWERRIEVIDMFPKDENDIDIDDLEI